MIGTVWLYHGQILQVESFGMNDAGQKTATFLKMGTECQPTYVWAEFLKEAFRLIRADTIV